MHGQQNVKITEINILRCTVSKTSKKKVCHTGSRTPVTLSLYRQFVVERGQWAEDNNKVAMSRIVTFSFLAVMK